MHMPTIFLGIDALGFNLPALIAQIINFALLLIIFRLVLYKPLLKMLDERKQRIQEGLDASDEAKRRLSQTEQEVAKEIDKARQEGQELIAQAQQISTRIQEESRQAARSEAEQLLERARGEIQLERDSAIAELRQEFAGLTITAAERVIEEELDANKHRRPHRGGARRGARAGRRRRARSQRDPRRRRQALRRGRLPDRQAGRQGGGVVVRPRRHGRALRRRPRPAVFENARVPASQKLALVERALAGVDPLVLNLARLLVRRRRTSLGPQIAQAFQELLDEAKGISHATVTSAVPLTDETVRPCSGGSSRSPAGRSSFETQVDENILGGLVVRIGDRLIDGSTKSRLLALKRRLAGASV